MCIHILLVKLVRVSPSFSRPTNHLPILQSRFSYWVTPTRFSCFDNLQHVFCLRLAATKKLHSFAHHLLLLLYKCQGLLRKVGTLPCFFGKCPISGTVEPLSLHLPLPWGWGWGGGAADRARPSKAVEISVLPINFPHSHRCPVSRYHQLSPARPNGSRFLHGVTGR